MSHSHALTTGIGGGEKKGTTTIGRWDSDALIITLSGVKKHFGWENNLGKGGNSCGALAKKMREKVHRDVGRKPGLQEAVTYGLMAVSLQRDQKM